MFIKAVQFDKCQRQSWSLQTFSAKNFALRLEPWSWSRQKLQLRLKFVTKLVWVYSRLSVLWHFTCGSNKIIHFSRFQLKSCKQLKPQLGFTFESEFSGNSKLKNFHPWRATHSPLNSFRDFYCPQKAWSIKLFCAKASSLRSFPECCLGWDVSLLSAFPFSAPIIPGWNLMTSHVNDT